MAYRMTLVRWGRLEHCLDDKGVTYYFKQGAGNNDALIYQTGNPEGRSKFHIHSIEASDGDDMVFEKLLAKSGNWRHGQEPDLAAAPMEEWVALCQGMDSSVVMAVDALRQCFEELGAKGPE